MKLDYLYTNLYKCFMKHLQITQFIGILNKKEYTNSIGVDYFDL